MLSSRGRRLRVPRLAVSRHTLSVRSRFMADRTAQHVSRNHLPLFNKKVLVWSLVAATGSLLAYSWYVQRSGQQQETKRYLRADSPREWPSTSSKDETRQEKGTDAASDKPLKRPDDPEKASYLPDWSAIGDQIRDAVVPGWAKELPNFVTKLQDELSDKPGSLADRVWQEAHDANIHPEIAREARVRVSDELCDEEKAFLQKRRNHVRKALAQYLDIPEDNIHPDDVPVIGMCGSGGGLRALVAGSSSYLSAQEAGLFDCVTYTAGVSGSCWLQSLYHSTLTNQDFGRLLQHLKSRISTHIAFPPSVLKLITNAPTHKYLLAGGIEKYKGMQDAEFGIVDVYGLLLAARLMVPKGELDVNPDNLKLSQQRQYLDDGEHPMPIYTAVRHELPSKETVDNDKQNEEIKEQSKKEAWFEWFEFTPYELWCEEFASGIPTWSVGRSFEDGRSMPEPEGFNLPELRIPLLQGIWGSAFCATLAHYYKEIRPLVKGLTGFGGIDKLLEDHSEDLVKFHPVAPTQIPNYINGMKEKLPDRCPDSIHESKQIQLMDAGMSNNLPVYPLLRPGREVDILVAFDASADIKTENWLRVADGYARQRGIKGWPIGTGWPRDDADGPENTGKGVAEADDTNPSEANKKLEEAAADTLKATSESTAQDSKTNTDQEGSKPSISEKAKQTLGYCTVWVGNTEERTSDTEPPQSKTVEDDWELMQPDAGIAVIYFPFMANPEVEGVDPEKSDFMSTWNFIYTAEDIDKVVALARANFKAGEEKTKMAIRAVYERKKQQRLEKEKSKP